MKIAYNLQSSNANKHPQMPDNYFYEKYEIEDIEQSRFEGLGYLVKTPEEFESIMSDIDLTAYNAAVAPTQAEKDMIRFAKRAAAKDLIIAEMATENMARLRSGTWTVPQLISLTTDAQLKDILGDITALSFEIAASKIPYLTNPILTTEIKTGWAQKLASHFYLG